MTLEAAFTPPDKAVSEAETAKRDKLISWFAELVHDSVVGYIVSGSMGYGANYSVKESSDIDMQLLVTPATVTSLSKLGVFDEQELAKALDGYLANAYGQFSLVFQKDGVSMECHFWDSQAFYDAITYKVQATARLRSGIDTPSTDHGFSFAREESIQDYYGEMVHGVPVGTFPSFRVVRETLYLCRPITNILGLPRVEKTTDALQAAISQTWDETVARLAKHSEGGVLDLTKFNIENTLPGKNKMRQDVLDEIRQKTREKLDALGINYTG
jgi:hypothetical protein